ncbi:uncharacterized protein LOC18425169, partial [Amborella trichopoda]|uniref:uncharacterized protein LOC18425169 n=1 Tax=Amborella trichopoda TaxID=13333 RepID=UPI0005D41BF4
MADNVKQLLVKPIQLADLVSKAAEDTQTCKQDCHELKAKTEKLAALLRQAARASADLYERPTRRIIDDTEQVLEKAYALVCKCKGNGLVKRVFTIIPAAAFKKMFALLENSIGDVSWLLRVSASGEDRGDLGLPPIAQNEPILCLIWEQIATLFTGSLEEKADAAASLVSLARDNDRYGKLIIEEGGVPPLLKLLKEGKIEGQESAALAIGLLGRDPESVDHMIHAGVCSAFAKLLKDGPMKVQAVVAWAVSELAANQPKCQDHFAQNNTIRLLVSHLAFETVQEHSKYTVAAPQRVGGMSIHSVVMANKVVNAHEDHGDHHHDRGHSIGNHTPVHPSSSQSRMHALVSSTTKTHHQNSSSSSSLTSSNGKQGLSLSGVSLKGREYEDPATKASMKAMAAKALSKLAKGNVVICRSITESKALLCFAVLLEKGPDEVQKNSAMALMEIASVAEQDAELRRSAFKPNSPAAKAVVDQLLRVVEQADSNLLVPCIIAIGCLARTFQARETRVIGPLVTLLDDREEKIMREAAIALTKFACTENYLHVDHSKAIIAAGGAKHLVQLVYFESMVQTPSLVLLCYIALNVPDSEALAQAEVLTVLERASKQGPRVQDPILDELLPEAKGRLELYQS